MAGDEFPAETADDDAEAARDLGKGDQGSDENRQSHHLGEAGYIGHLADTVVKEYAGQCQAQQPVGAIENWDRYIHEILLLALIH
jgi:hypothetical protein